MNSHDRAFWSGSVEELLAALQSQASGLAHGEATKRLASQSSITHRHHRRSHWGILVQQFSNPIAWLLMVSAVLSFFMEDTTNALIILFILVASGLLSFWQESSAANAVAKLLHVIETKVLVLRDQSETLVPIQEVVPGDVVLLKAGSIIPGDCRLLTCRELCVDESTLTGESFPVEKTLGTLEASTSLAKRTNAAFLGTHVVSGTGTAVVVYVGESTEFGKISARLALRAPRSGFEIGLRRFGSFLLWVTLALVAVVFLAQIFLQRDWIESLLFALALAVGMTPQLLPAITSVVLASGAIAMSKSQVIVKRLLAIENFGGMDTLCVDKTGTLTEGKLRLVGAQALGGCSSSRLLELAKINATLQASFENPIDRAIDQAEGTIPANVHKIDELPYDFARKRLSVVVEMQGVRTLITKGALASVLEICDRCEVDAGKIVALPLKAETIQKEFEVYSEQGLRVLGLAYRDHSADRLEKQDEVGLIFGGFLVFEDPLKQGVRETMRQLTDLGIQLKLITGDNRAVAATIGARVGLSTEGMITGKELHAWDTEQLRREVRKASIFAEIEPEQKERIVLALKGDGNVVGFLGDGINDAPALHSADVGISVAQAVDVAREAAQVVLLRYDLDVLIQGVREGRRTLANTLKYIFFAISANFGYMLSTAIASLFLPFLPLLPTQILLVNLMADFPAMALATDSVDDELIRRPRKWDLEAIFRFMLTFGLMGTCSDLLTFAGLIWIFDAPEEIFQTSWFVLSILTGLLILMAMRTERPFFRSRPSLVLLSTVLVVAAAAVVLPFTRMGSLFGLVPIHSGLLWLVLAIATAYITAIEVTKRILRNSASARLQEANE
ncbi:MAG: magnesium-translocating P-type ATPase [Pirellulales bacterium]